MAWDVVGVCGGAAESERARERERKRKRNHWKFGGSADEATSRRVLDSLDLDRRMQQLIATCTMRPTMYWTPLAHITATAQAIAVQTAT